MLYLLVNVAVLSVPLAFSWHSRIRFVQHWPSLWRAGLLSLGFFIAWDIPFAKMGIWGFNENYLVGVGFLGLPIEEWLFFACVPYACVFTYESLRSSVFARRIRPLAIPTTWLAFIAILIVVLVASGRLYTTTVGIFAAAFLGFLLLARPQWLADFWVSTLALAAPFVATNGILTGVRFWTYPLVNHDAARVADYIVRYNNAENLGVRITSIPVEDFVYALLLIGLNVALFEYFKQSRSLKLSSEITPT
ncbi:MAG: lycopene cyclase domain-containing protein [Rubricoccaceae bacterium]|nr:lycopene cyclase domain-containing protein [Rubricoccaceae bacterium]